jgi:hypothetical protein
MVLHSALVILHVILSQRVTVLTNQEVLPSLLEESSDNHVLISLRVVNLFSNCAMTGVDNMSVLICC